MFNSLNNTFVTALSKVVGPSALSANSLPESDSLPESAAYQGQSLDEQVVQSSAIKGKPLDHSSVAQCQSRDHHVGQSAVSSVPQYLTAKCSNQLTNQVVNYLATHMSKLGSAASFVGWLSNPTNHSASEYMTTLVATHRIAYSTPHRCGRGGKLHRNGNRGCERRIRIDARCIQGGRHCRWNLSSASIS